jgi:hypothetical protein
MHVKYSLFVTNILMNSGASRLISLCSVHWSHSKWMTGFGCYNGDILTKCTTCSYFQCLMYLYHHPDVWYDYATWHAKNGSTDSAIKIFQRAVKALPGNWISCEIIFINSVMMSTSVVRASSWKLVSIWFTERLWACYQDCGKIRRKTNLWNYDFVLVRSFDSFIYIFR